MSIISLRNLNKKLESVEVASIENHVARITRKQPGYPTTVTREIINYLTLGLTKINIT